MVTQAGSMDLILQGAKSSSGQTAPPRAIEPQSPNGIFAARAEFVQHLAHEIQRLHPDRCLRSTCGLHTSTPHS